MNPTNPVHLRPSSAKRWMNCPGSVWLLEKGTSKGSKAADIGTSVHKLIEDKLLDETFDLHAQKGTKTFEEGMSRPISITDKMIGDAQWALDEIDGIKAKCGNKIKLYSERFYKINQYSPERKVMLPGGSVDVTIIDINNKTLYIVDYKNGAIHVEHVDNPQLMLYAYACLINFKGFQKEDLTKWTIICTILQPNSRLKELGKHRLMKFNAQYIKDWFDLTVVPAIAEVERSANIRKAGEHCLFCNTAQCGEYQTYKNNKTLLDMSDELRDILFVKKEEVKNIDKNLIVDIYDNLKSYQSLLNLVKKEVEKDAKEYGYDIIVKEGNTKVDEDIYKTIFKEDIFYKRKPLSQTELKQLVSDGQIDEQDLQRVIVKTTKEVLKKNVIE